MIGVGGMGAVYLATDRTLERQVAIKLHHTVGGTARLQREAVAMARLAHPNVITVFEVGMLGEQAFVAMEYIAGTTLRGWLAAAPRTTRERLATLFAAGTGLAAAHDAGLVHRDFKPENVLVGDDGRARVGDFGLARGSRKSRRRRARTERRGACGGESGNLAAPLTQTGTVLGTPAYMAPEQAVGGNVDARADQFAFCRRGLGLCSAGGPSRATLAEMHEGRALEATPSDGCGCDPRSDRCSSSASRSSHPSGSRTCTHCSRLRRASRSRVPLVVGGLGVLGAAMTAVAIVGRGQAPSCDDAGAEVATKGYRVRCLTGSARSAATRGGRHRAGGRGHRQLRGGLPDVRAHRVPRRATSITRGPTSSTGAAWRVSGSGSVRRRCCSRPST